MPLTRRRVAAEVPSYSISSDLLGFLDCGLRYRYQHRGALPPSRPVQFWAGLFVHGVLEEALRHWRERDDQIPWPPGTVERLANLVMARLGAQGVSFRGFQMLGFALERATVAIETWGPDLFPLIDAAEIRLRHVRPMPAQARSIRGNRYEVQGVADVIARHDGTSVARPLAFAGVVLAGSGPIDVVVDYKGMRRPGLLDPAWERQQWQVQTYAWLRKQQPDARLHRAALLLYLNELVPGPDDVESLRREVLMGLVGTDVMPRAPDLVTLEQWPELAKPWRRQIREWERQVRAWYLGGRASDEAFPRMPLPEAWLSPSYRRGRSIRYLGVDDAGIEGSLARFDEVVARIERCVTAELGGQRLTAAWPTFPGEDICMRCDFRSHCPAPGNRHRGAPKAP